MADDVAIRARWIDDVSGKVAETARRVKQEFSLLNVASVALGTVGGLSIQAGFNAATSALREASKATIEQERADRALENALRSQGQLTQERFDALKEYANELQRTSAFTDDQVQQAQATAIALGVQVERINTLTDAAAVLAVTIGTDLSSAMRTLVKGELGGAEGPLKRLIGDFKNLDEAIEKLASRKGAIVDMQLGPAEAQLNALQDELDESRERLGGLGTAFTNVGLQAQVGLSHLLEYVAGLKDLFDALNNVNNIEIGSRKGQPGLIHFDKTNPNAPTPAEAYAPQILGWYPFGKPPARPDYMVGPNQFTPDPNALDTDQIVGTAPDRKAAAKILDDWKKQQAEYEDERKAFVDDLIEDRKAWVEEFTRLMGFEPKMPDVTIGKDGKPVQGRGYRFEEDLPVGTREEFERRRGFEAFKGETAEKNAQDFIGGFQDAIVVIDATGESISEMTAVIGEAQQWTNRYIESKEKEAEATRLASSVASSLADSFEENFSDIVEAHEGFFENLAQIVGAGLSRILDEALNSIGGGVEKDIGGWLGGLLNGIGGGGGGGGTAAGPIQPGVWESSVRGGFDTEPTATGPRWGFEDGPAREPAAAYAPEGRSPIHVTIVAGAGNTVAAAAMAGAQPTVPAGSFGQDFDDLIEGYIVPMVLNKVGVQLQRGGR